MPSLCAVCGHTVLPEVGAAVALALWTLEAAAQGAVVALLFLLWARLFRWRVPFWPITKMALMETPERYCFSICGFCRPKWNEALTEWKAPE